MTLPLVVNENLVDQFDYWSDGIQKGICYNHELYTYSQSYLVHDRLKAYDVAYEHSNQGTAVCITVSKNHYTIWLSLRSPNRMTAQDFVSVE